MIKNTTRIHAYNANKKKYISLHFTKLYLYFKPKDIQAIVHIFTVNNTAREGC